jgi:hydroxyacylglutathione hydrolase
MKDLLVRRIIGTDYKSNSYIIFNNNSKKSLIIDPNDYIQISQFMKEKRLINEFILLTHEHYDHVAALSLVKKNIGGLVISSVKCNKGLANVQSLLNRTYGLYMNFIGSEKREIPQFDVAGTDKTFCGELQINWDNSTIILKETLGHSNGSISIYFVDDMIFSGDSYLYEKPIISRMQGGNKEDFIKSTLAYYSTLPRHIKVYPGHGEMFLLKDKKWEYKESPSKSGIQSAND